MVLRTTTSSSGCGIIKSSKSTKLILFYFFFTFSKRKQNPDLVKMELRFVSFFFFSFYILVCSVIFFFITLKNHFVPLRARSSYSTSTTAHNTQQYSFAFFFLFRFYSSSRTLLYIDDTVCLSMQLRFKVIVYKPYIPYIVEKVHMPSAPKRY